MMSFVTESDEFLFTKNQYQLRFKVIKTTDMDTDTELSQCQEQCIVDYPDDKQFKCINQCNG